jgi:WD40 repeat protein
VAQRRRRLHSDWVSVAAFSPDGKTLVTGSAATTRPRNFGT